MEGSHKLGVSDAIIFVGMLLAVFVLLQPREEASFAAPIINRLATLETPSREIIDEAAKGVMTVITIPAEGEVIDLPFKPRTLAIDPATEEQMLALVNAEREREGLKLLVLDQSITEVARTHSHDMWQRQYFAHINPDGDDPFMRMQEGEVEFVAAGENLALSRSLERAHEGLMNSPGHRRNILDPKFGRIGIGVVDGGIYGKMFTQNFAD